MTIKQSLKECQVFQQLPDEQLEKVAALCSQETYEAGATIFQAGSNAGQLFVLVEGKVAMQMEMSAPQSQLRKRVAVDVASKGDLMGWSSMVEPNTYTLSATCLQKAKVLTVDAAKLASLLQKDCLIAREVLQGLVNVVALRLHDTMQLLVAERSLV